MTKTVYIVDLEAVDTRYTGEWKTHVPKLLRDAGLNTEVIEGPTDIPAATTPGAFLNFGGTNVYKAAQLEKISRLFCSGNIKSGDHFVFTDAWNPAIINLKYMCTLLNIPVTITGLWHAGNYDKHVFLGRVKDSSWLFHTEKALFDAIDHNCFATNFHIELFAQQYSGDKSYIHDWILKNINSGKILRTGWPMEYMPATLEKYKGLPKRDLIIFPHRIAPEKQVDIFRDLATALPEFEFVVCQDKKLTKDEYHTLLGQSKILFSASLQETLGIGPYEGAILGVIPLLPDRLSYTEMYDSKFLYPDHWTIDANAYLRNKTKIIARIRDMMLNYDTLTNEVSNTLAPHLLKNYFSANILINTIKGKI